MLYIRCAGQYRNVTRACQKQVLEVWHGRNGKKAPGPEMFQIKCDIKNKECCISDVLANIGM